MGQTGVKQEVSDKWKAYWQDPTEEARNPLVEEYMQLVRYNAERIRAKLPNEVEIDDLVSSGTFGLLDAIKAFDPGRGVKFETFCVPRIRGAILDELRSMDWIPRLVRSRGQMLQQAASSLEAELGRKPSQEEVAEQLGIAISDVDRLQRETVTVSTVSLSRTCYETDSQREVHEIDIIEDRSSVDPALEVQKKDVRELVTKSLSRAERLIILLYYYEQMTMKEIGATLDLSESRVSQMHSSVLERLKGQLGRGPQGVYRMPARAVHR